MAIKKRNDDEFLDNLIQPISDIYEETNYKVLSIITERILSIGKMTPTDAARLSILLKNQDLKQIETILSEATKLSIKEIDSIVIESASYNDDLSEELFKARNMPPATFSTDLSLLTIVEQAKKSMIGDVVRLSNTTAFVINGKVTDIGKTYNYAVNRAVFEVQQGLFDFNTAMKSTIKELADSGLRVNEFGETQVQYESGNFRRLDSALRLNIAEGVRQTNNAYRERQGQIYGADMVFITGHSLVAPDHAFINGRDFPLDEWNDIESNLKRKLSTNNCRHTKSYGIKGISENPYSEEELQQMIDSSNKEVTYTTRKKDLDGNYIKKTLPRYQATQVQRNLETEIRKLKDYKNQLDVLGDKTESNIVQKKIRDKTKYYKSVSEQIGISPRMERTRVVK